MDGDEPTLVFSRLEDLPEAIRIADDMGLPLTNPPDVEDEMISSSSVAPWPTSTWRTRVSGGLRQPGFHPTPYPSRTRNLVERISV